ncbi:hypothetical protein BKA65DRAFT_211527 [Rhexocercosporidium sp. MPI-PUGE-AT-0058]|nr:hypothetical protein BKA65DRAFT_211527 [Rhexocercosporidium sp. MPI-PUGE-AT-0058]
MLWNGTACWRVCIAPLPAFDLSSFLILVDTSQPAETQFIIPSPYASRQQHVLESLLVSWFGYILAWGLFSSLCCAISSLRLSECVSCKIFVCASPFSLYIQNGLLNRKGYGPAAASLLWFVVIRAGWETGCAFLYGVIAIGVVYQRCFLRI